MSDNRWGWQLLFYAGLLVAAWAAVWILLLLIGDYLRVDRLARALDSPEGSVNVALAAVVSVAFCVAVLAAAARR